MKKLLVAAAAVVALSASALEVGVNGVESSAQNHRYGSGLTVGESFGGVGLTAGYTRLYREADDQTRWSLVADKSLVKVGPVDVTGRVGYAYLDNETSRDGSAVTVGAGASVDLTKKVSLGVSIDRQYGQTRVDQFNGNIVTAGIKVGF